MQQYVARSIKIAYWFACSAYLRPRPDCHLRTNCSNMAEDGLQVWRKISAAEMKVVAHKDEGKLLTLQG